MATVCNILMWMKKNPSCIAYLLCEYQEFKSFLAFHPSSGVQTINTVGSHLNSPHSELLDSKLSSKLLLAFSSPELWSLPAARMKCSFCARARSFLTNIRKLSSLPDFCCCSCRYFFFLVLFLFLFLFLLFFVLWAQFPGGSKYRIFSSSQLWCCAYVTMDARPAERRKNLIAKCENAVILIRLMIPQSCLETLVSDIFEEISIPSRVGLCKIISRGDMEAPFSQDWRIFFPWSRYFEVIITIFDKPREISEITRQKWDKINYLHYTERKSFQGPS